MESQPDPRFTQHKVEDWVLNFAAWRPKDWFSASHVARKLDRPVEAVRTALNDMTRDWLVAWLHYECPDHEFTLLERRAEEPVGEDEFITCTGEALGEGHEVRPSPEDAMLVFYASDTLIDHAKKEKGEPVTLSSPEDEEVGVDDSDSAVNYNIRIGVLNVGGHHVGDTTSQQFGDIRASGNVTITNLINSAGAKIVNDVRNVRLEGISDEAKQTIEQLALEIRDTDDLTRNEQKDSLEVLDSIIEMLKKQPQQRDKGFLQSAFGKIKGIVKRAKPVLDVVIKVAALVLVAL